MLRCAQHCVVQRSRGHELLEVATWVAEFSHMTFTCDVHDVTFLATCAVHHPDSGSQLGTREQCLDSVIWSNEGWASAPGSNFTDPSRAVGGSHPVPLRHRARDTRLMILFVAILALNDSDLIVSKE